MKTEDELLDADDASNILKVKRGTVYSWAALGLIPHIRILAGKRRPVVRFRRSELERFLEERSIGSSETTHNR